VHPDLKTCASTDVCGSHLLRTSDIPPRRARQAALSNRLNTRCVASITVQSPGDSGPELTQESG
jgi:hypothetical protein